MGNKAKLRPNFTDGVHARAEDCEGKWEMFATSEQAILMSVAQQLVCGGEVELDGEPLPVKRVGGERLRMVRFQVSGREYNAIEQSHKKSSRWAQLARENHRVVQFQDVLTNKYVAVSVDGRLTEYGRG